MKPRKTAAMDRLWVERLAGRVCRRPRLVTLLAILLTIGALVSTRGLRVDTNILKLLPDDAESLRYQTRMAMESDLSPLYNIVPAEDLEALAEIERRALDEPTIARFESVLQYLPQDEAASQEALGELRPLVDALSLSNEPERLEPERLAESLDRLELALADASEAAFTAGLGDLAGGLEEARAVAEEVRVFVDEVPEATVLAWQDQQARALEWARDGLDWLRRAVRAAPPTSDTLPAEVRERFFTRSGRPLAFLFPAGDVFNPDDLAPYVEASRRVSSAAIGFPLVFDKMSRRIVEGFRGAVLAGGALVLVILLIDFRSMRDALLAMVPLLIGITWMMGAMRLFGLTFNLANLVAIPLIIGIGIDNGVHVMQRVRLEGRAGMGVVLRHTGRAILIASLTTMIGFGSLALASHRGLSSLGFVLLLGVGSCLVTSMVVLPNLLVWLGVVDP